VKFVVVAFCNKPAAIGTKASFPGFIETSQPSKVARPPSGPL